MAIRKSASRLALALAFASTSLFAASAALGSAKGLAGRGLRCIETVMDDEGNDVTLANVVVRFGADGKASQVRVTRPKTVNFPAVNETLTPKDSKIADVIRPGVIEGVDEETKENYYSYGISEFQEIRAQRGDFSISIAVDDHMYVGVYGSTVILKKGAVSVKGLDSPDSGDAMVSCKVTR